MTTRIALRTLLLAGVLMSRSGAQTIPVNDLPFFVGAAIKTHAAVRDSTHMTWFDRFFIDSVNPQGSRVSDTMHVDLRSDREWVAVRSQPIQLEDCYFVSMVEDVGGPSETQTNYLTVWQSQANGRVSLLCTPIVEFGNLYASTKVLAAVTFPDGSTMLHIEESGGDEVPYHSDLFLRGVDNCHFVVFYSLSWDWEQTTRISVLSDRVQKGQYRMTVVREYVTPDTIRIEEEGTYGAVVDSVQGEVIDLWQLAIQKFHIDTTAISRNH